MSLRLVAAICLVGLLGATVSRADNKELAAETKKLQGTWMPAENILNGAPTPETVLKHRRTVVKDDAYENLNDGKVESKGTWNFVAKKDKFLHIDLYPVEGPGKGKVVKGIAEFVGEDGWRLCMPAEPDGERPTEFASKEGSGLFLRTYKRVAPLALQTFEEGHGSPLVMLGGGTDGAAAFAPHARTLAQHFRVVRPQSLRVERALANQSLPPGYSIKSESAALAQALDSLAITERVDLVGHSFGALMALDFALDRPDRVRTLVLIEPPAFWVVPLEELRADAQMRGMVELVRTFGPADEPTDEQLVRFQARLGRDGAKPLAAAEPGGKEWAAKRAALRGLSAVADHADDPARLKDLQVPVLIVTGKDTVAFHRRINDILAARLPKAERVELPGGHRAPDTARDEFVTELRAFLGRHR